MCGATEAPEQLFPPYALIGASLQGKGVLNENKISQFSFHRLFSTF